MSRQIQDAYIVAAVRTPIGKAPRGVFRSVRPDDLLAHVIRSAAGRLPGLDRSAIEDVVVGCAMPEGEQGLNVARIALLLAGLPNTVGGITINRFCSSGLNAVSIAADRIRVGEADVVIAAGTESMSMVPMSGFHPSFNEKIYTDENYGIAYGMGMTAERVAQQWKVTREAQDEFALASHQRALAAQAKGEFSEIAPYAFTERTPDLGTRRVAERARTVSQDEGPRADTSAQALAKLRPVFAAKGSVTAGMSACTASGEYRFFAGRSMTRQAKNLITPIDGFDVGLADFVAFQMQAAGILENLDHGCLRSHEAAERCVADFVHHLTDESRALRTCRAARGLLSLGHERSPSRPQRRPARGD